MLLNQETFGSLDTFLEVTTEGSLRNVNNVLLASSGSSFETSYSAQDSSTTRNYLAPNVDNDTVKKPWIRRI